MHSATDQRIIDIAVNAVLGRVSRTCISVGLLVMAKFS